jgi:hypothetical protein
MRRPSTSWLVTMCRKHVGKPHHDQRVRLCHRSPRRWTPGRLMTLARRAARARKAHCTCFLARCSSAIPFREGGAGGELSFALGSLISRLAADRRVRFLAKNPRGGRRRPSGSGQRRKGRPEPATMSSTAGKASRWGEGSRQGARQGRSQARRLSLALDLPGRSKRPSGRGRGARGEGIWRAGTPARAATGNQTGKIPI